MIYLATFALSVILLYLSGRCEGALRAILTLVGLTIPCLLAGLRDESVGVDIQSYAKWMCIAAPGSRFETFIGDKSGVAGIGWNSMTWLVCSPSGNLHLYLFAIAALCVVPVYLGLRRFLAGSEWVGMLVWFLLFYAFSLNGMRQSVAMSIVFFASSYALEKRKLPFFLWVAIATTFHQTAIICILIYPFIAAIRGAKGMRLAIGNYRSQTVMTVSLVLIGMVFAFGGTIVQYAVGLKDSYSYQAERLGGNDVSYAGLYLVLVASVLYLQMKPRTRDRIDASTQFVEDLNMFTCLALLFVLGAVLLQLNIVADTLGRLGYYLLPFVCYLVALLSSRRERGWNSHSVVFLSFVYFVTMTLLLGKEGVVPYESSALRAMFWMN